MTDTMRDKDTISKGPKRRDEACLQTLHDITIPAGTILRQESGKDGVFSCLLTGGEFVIDQASADAWSGAFKRVIA